MIVDTKMIRGWEVEIDQLVYSRYSLARKEIAIIEEILQEKTTSGQVADDSAVEE